MEGVIAQNPPTAILSEMAMFHQLAGATIS
jgi:hypothetical protein